MAAIASKIFEVDKRRHGVVGRDNSCTKDINKLSKTKKFRLAFRQGESYYLVIYNLTYNCDTAIYMAYKPLRPRCNQMCAYNTPCNDQNFHRCPQTSQRQKAKNETNGKRKHTSHRFISTSSLHLIIRHLSLLAFTTFKLICSCIFRCSALCIEDISLLQFLILLTTFVASHFL